jgi:DNA-binding ferritin-like protein (Dps family)
MNDQENIRRIQQVDNRTRKIHKGREEEWNQIHKEMEAGSGATKVNVSTVFSGELPTLASVLQDLKKELQNQGDAVADFETQDWQDEGEWIAQGWCEALEFAIKTIKRHNKSCEADQ